MLLAADRIAAYFAADALASQVQTSEHLARKPDVSIGGIPFLTQALSGNYGEVDVSMRGLSAGQGLQVDRLDAALRGVHVPLGSVLNGSVRQAPVDQATAVAIVAYSSLQAVITRQVGVSPSALTFTPAGTDQVVVAGEVPTSQGRLRVRATARLRVVGGRLAVGVVPGSVTGVPAQLRREAASLLTTSLTLPALPFGFQVAGVTVSATGVTLTATGRNIVLGAR